jgi:symplekin
MQRARHEAFDESNRKRPAPSEPTDGLDHTKRQRVTAEVVNRPSSVPPLPSGPVSWRDLYTLNPSGSTVNFDVQAFKDPEQLLRILVPVLQSVDAQKLDHSINVRDLTQFSYGLIDSHPCYTLCRMQLPPPLLICCD